MATPEEAAAGVLGVLERRGVTGGGRGVTGVVCGVTGGRRGWEGRGEESWEG